MSVTILDALDDLGLFGDAFPGESWRPWRSFLATLFGLPMDDSTAQLARHHSGRQDAATAGPFRECWCVVGRRAGKSRILALIAAYLAAFVSWRPRLAAGETGVIMILATDRDQAGVILGYVRGLFRSNPMLAQLVTDDGADWIELGALSAELVADPLADDPEAGAAEWLAEFRRDIAAFVAPAVIDAAVVPGRHELPCVLEVRYVAFLDPSGGSADSFTLAIAHREDERAVLDVLREVRPPFSPENVVSEFAATMLAYGCTRAVADRYAGAWVAEAFLRAGVTVEQCAKPKSDLYGELLPGLNSGRVDLLDHPRLIAQLAGLERRTARGGRDSIDHGPGARDDLANAAAGALAAILARRPSPGLNFSDCIFNMPSDPPDPDWRSDLTLGGSIH